MHIDGRLKIGTVCSGIGAPEKALSNLGIDYSLSYFCEFDKFAEKSYCAIHNSDTTKNLGDLTKVDIDKLPHDLDLLVGGTPCQDFSIAGLRKGGKADSGTRSSLMWNFVSIIKETQPKVVIWENVAGCVMAGMQGNYWKFIKVLDQIGYKTLASFLNAKDFGIPQDRKRVFVVAVRKDLETHFTMPTGYDCGIRLKDILEKDVDEKFYLSTKQVEKLINQSESKRKRGMGFKFAPTQGDGMAKTVTTHEGTVVDCNWVSENKPIELTSGQSQGYRIYSWDGCSVTLAAEAGGMGAKTGLYLVGENKPLELTTGKSQGSRIYDDGGVCPTVCTTANALCKSYNRVRKLTPKECFRLMGFSDEDFDRCSAVGISNAQLYKQAGNSIAVNVLMAIFGVLYNVDWKEKVYGNRLDKNKLKTRKFLWSRL